MKTGDPDPRYQAEPDEHRTTEPLEDEDGETYTISQQAVGSSEVEGGGEFPDKETPPRAPAPGSVEE